MDKKYHSSVIQVVHKKDYSGPDEVVQNTMNFSKEKTEKSET